MATSTLGTKFICFMCQCKFYDLNRPDPLCPRCGANQKDVPKPAKASSSRSRAAAERVVKEEVYTPAEEEAEEEAMPVSPASLLDDEGGDEADEPAADED